MVSTRQDSTKNIEKMASTAKTGVKFMKWEGPTMDVECDTPSGMRHFTIARNKLGPFEITPYEEHGVSFDCIVLGKHHRKSGWTIRT